MASIYEHGFYHGNRWSGPDLGRVLDEVARLEEHWVVVGLPPDVLANLRERAGYLRAPVGVAVECGGCVAVG